jgi:hypothetical protein
MEDGGSRMAILDPFDFAQDRPLSSILDPK